jgi:hypothetical protein
VKYLILLLVSLPAFANVVKVTSVYQDESDPKRQLKVSGSGLILKAEGRQFVFTASHVSQGKDTEVSLNGAVFKINARVRHGNNDLELLEVGGADPSAIKAELNGGLISYDASANPRRRWIDKYDFVVLQDWINDPQLAPDSAYAQTRGPVLAMDIFSALLNGETIVQPGTSGAPLITVVPQAWHENSLPYDVREGFRNAPAGQSFVRGLAIRRDRFYAHASFVPAARMTALLRDFLAGKAQPKTITEWRASGAVLFRKGEVYQETAAYSSATAGGTVTDIGNAVTMEGGDLATLGEDSPSEFLDKVSAFPVSGTEPVMFWLLAMRHPKTSELINFWSWFDMELFPLFTRGGDLFASFVRESPTLNLAGQLGPRFGKRGDFEVKNLKVDAAGVHVNIPLANDRLTFSLSRSGIYGAKTHFQPVIEVPSQKGRVYLVDLRELFFVDTASSRTDPLRAPGALDFTRDELVAAVYDEMQAEIGRPRLSFRLKRADAGEPMTTEQGQRSVLKFY